MPEITIYTTMMCPYCSAAKALLKRKGATYEEIDISQNRDLRKEMAKKAGGRRTVPQIFINGMHIGGCDELHALEGQEKLDGLLAL